MLSPKKANLFLLFLLLYQFVFRMLFSYIFMIYESDFYLNPLFIIISQVLNFGFPFLIYMQKTSSKASAIIPMRRLNPTNMGLIILMSLTVQPLMMILSAITSLFFENRVPSAISSLSAYSEFVLVAVFAVGPAVFEELIFRGIILSNYKYVDIKVTALLNGLFFALMHMDPHQFLYAFAIGVMLAYIVYYTESILSAILSHFVINFTQIILSLDSGDGLINVTSLLVMACIMSPVFIIIFRSFVGYNKRIKNTLEIITYLNDLGEPRPLKPPSLALWTLLPVLAYYGFYMVFVYDLFGIFSR